MKEEMIGKIIKVIENSAEFASSEMSDFCQGVIKYGIINACAGLAFGIVVFVTCFLFLPKVKKDYDDMDKFFLGCLCVFFGLLSLALILESTQDIVTAYLTPKVYILKHIKNF